MRRMMSSLATLIILGLPSLVTAECAGADMRPALTPMEQSALDHYTDGVPYAQGNHWRAEKDGEVLNVIGTLHIADPRMEAITARLHDTIAQSALLLLESTTEQTQSFESKISANPSLILNTGRPLSEQVSPDIWPVIADRVQTLGMAPRTADGLKPWYVSLMMGLPDCLLGPSPATYGLDKRLEAVAEKQGVPTQSLEPIETVFRIFSKLDYAEQIQMLEITALQRQDINDQTATMIETYLEENTVDGWMLGKVLAERTNAYPVDRIRHLFDRNSQLLLSHRNRQWIPVLLDALANTDGPVTTATGAAHLAGTEGLLNLLENEGSR